jgi:hypothetical protein
VGDGALEFPGDLRCSPFEDLAHPDAGIIVRIVTFLKLKFIFVRIDSEK